MTADNRTSAQDTEQVLLEQDLAEHWFSFLHKTFGQIKNKMKERGISQEQLAKRLGADPAFVSRALRGESNMTLRTMFKFARAMNYRMEVNFVDLSQVARANRRYIDHPWGSLLGSPTSNTAQSGGIHRLTLSSTAAAQSTRHEAGWRSESVVIQ